MGLGWLDLVAFLTGVVVGLVVAAWMVSERLRAARVSVRRVPLPGGLVLESLHDGDRVLDQRVRRGHGVTHHTQPPRGDAA